MNYILKIMFLLGAVLVISNPSWGAIYKCPTKNGGITYSNTPCESGARKDGDTWVNLNDEREQKARQDELRRDAIEKARTQRDKAQIHYAPDSGIAIESGTPTTSKSMQSRFRCDGRIHCSQMTSCEEATFFLMNCPNTKMDGNNDGVPCEQQWCETGSDSNFSGRRRH